MIDQELPWAKLIAIQPDKQNIALYSHSSADTWSISQNQDGKIFIKNISAPYFHVEETTLQINEERELLSGERLCFHSNQETNIQFDYVFCVTNFQSDLKRDRDETIESESLQKLGKIETDFQKELICSICRNLLHKCMVLTPCQHAFCGSCLFHHLKSSSQCPLCRIQAVSLAKSPLLSNLIQLTGDSFPILKRSRDGKEHEEISLGGMITRNEEGVYIGSYINSKKSGQGKMIYNDGRIYEGGWRNDKREGKGVFISSNGEKYDGSWMNDLKHGAGKYIWRSGKEYEGNFKNDLKAGSGTMKYRDGRIYQGDWKNSQKEGKGTLTFSDGDKYEGKWINGVLQSEVKVFYSNGRKYEGKIDVKSFKKHGKGTFILENDNKYLGVWMDDVLQSQVTIKYINGEKYVGEIEVGNFKKHGKGVLIFKNGGRYDGDWMGDKQHGHGKEIYQDGKRVFEGVWREGKISGEAIMTDEYGIHYRVERIES